MTNPMMDALTQKEQVILDYMADSMLIFGNQSPDRIAEIFNVKKQYEEDPQFAFPGKGLLKPQDEELRQLKRQLERVQEERDILKKALAYFAEHQK